MGAAPPVLIMQIKTIGYLKYSQFFMSCFHFKSIPSSDYLWGCQHVIEFLKTISLITSGIRTYSERY